MNHTIKSLFLAAAVALSGLLGACDDAIDLPRTDTGNLDGVAQTHGYVRNLSEPRSTTTAELRAGQSVRTEIYFGMTRPAAKSLTATFAFDASALEEYNLANATSYTLYPEASVSLASNGRTLIDAGEQRSGAVAVTVSEADGLVEGQTYAVPLRAKVSDDAVKTAAGEDIYLLLVKYMGRIPDPSKSTGIKILSCMEVNDTNPLNNLEFTLKNSGKMLVDIVVLFAANMNYDAATGRVYISNNENIQHLLDNRDKYLKPLQDHGMKVVLAMMGNHDQAGVAGLADDTARDFARQLKALCEAYDLDGIFWDDEYSKYAAGPGFVYPASSAAAARLIYETKRAMPDKLNIVYMAYAVSSWQENIPGLLNTLPDVDGVQAAAYADYAINDYNRTDLPAWGGITWPQVAIYPEEYAKGVFNMRVTDRGNEYQLMRERKCGIHMIFAMDPNRANFQGDDEGQLFSMRNIARELFGDQLEWSGKTYAKDW